MQRRSPASIFSNFETKFVIAIKKSKPCFIFFRVFFGFFTGVKVLSGSGAPETPDAVFPNNWFSSHSAEEQLQGGSSRFILYPMTSPTRQIEKRPDVIRLIVDHLHLRHSELIDLSHFERQGKFLEGMALLQIRPTVFVSSDDK